MNVSIEADPPLDDARAEILLAFADRVERQITSSIAITIAMTVARLTLINGASRLPHKEFARRSGSGRRTVDGAIKRLKREGIIERVGTTVDGVAIYRAGLSGGANGLA